MTSTTKALIESVNAAAAETTQYISPASGKGTIIDKFTGTNTTAGALTMSVKLVPSGGAAAASNTIVLTKSLAAGEAYTFPEVVGHVLAPGDFISTLPSATGITIRSSGRELT
jgi:hypothetical protein